MSRNMFGWVFANRGESAVSHEVDKISTPLILI